MRWFQLVFKRFIQKKMQEMLAPIPPVVDGAAMQLKLPDSNQESLASRLVAELSEGEKLSLLAGVSEFCIPAVARVGLKPVWMSDASMGLRGWKAPVTDFPAMVAMAATFNRALLLEAGRTLGRECRALGVGVLLGPGVNIARVPVCGRNFEYCGEDPYLAGEIAASYIQGVQGEGVVATVKHYACNNSEHDRHKSNSVVDERTLREIYLPAFKRSVEAGALAVMTSYNQVNGIYTSEHPYLLDVILRNEWGFEGLVVSDWNSLYSTVGALNDGVDLEMPASRWFSPDKVRKALSDGSVSMQSIDAKLLHLFTAYERANLFSRPLVDPSVEVGCASHREVALSVASEGVVLLKNEGSLLPLKKRPGMVVCVGGANAFKVAAGGGSSHIIPLMDVNSFASLMLKEDDMQVVLLPPSWQKKASYRSKVASSDAVIMVTGFDHILESEAYDKSWALPKGERAGIEAASNLNKRTILVVQSGGAVHLKPFIDAIPAALFAFFLGTSTAKALADLIFGRENPSGKLPFTMAYELEDYTSMRNYPKKYANTSLKQIRGGQGDPTKGFVRDLEYNEALMVGYRQFDTDRKAVLFPFGHGLSYTEFTYSDLTLRPAGGGSVLVSACIENSGLREGMESVQLYVHELEPALFGPEQELKGFVKVRLAPQERVVVEFELTVDAFSHYRPDAWRFVPGEGAFEIRVGSSSRDVRLHGFVEPCKG
ncbi:MAG: glycoside hydrolase family 3 N-terminal domain-containing protein [Sphaerochaeta sp.]|nr:glycoside hydrolase family 3 N-terminal domain-containing protein [Sphaerochaeta sp.]